MRFPLVTAYQRIAEISGAGVSAGHQLRTAKDADRYCRGAWHARGKPGRRAGRPLPIQAALFDCG